MKNLKRKSLFLVLFMLVAVLMFSITSFAATTEKCTCENPTVYDGEVIEPGCITQGYTEVLCTACNKLVATKDVKEAYNHSYGDAQYEAAGDGYNKYYECTREGCETPGVKHYEYATNTEKAVYYKVEFVNPWNAEEFDPAIKYANIVSVYGEKVVSSVYVKGGEAIAEQDRPASLYARQKDKSYGRYSFKGWTLEKTAYVEGVDVTLQDITAPVTANTKYYAYFEGVQVYHSVIFYSEKGYAITSEIIVPHGEAVDATKYEEKAVKAETVANRYVFSGWDTDTTAIYGDVQIVATYETIAQDYLFKVPNLVKNGDSWVYDESASVSEDNMLKVNLNYGYQQNANILSSITSISKAKDATYEYKWTGQWQLKNYKGYIVDPRNIILPDTIDPAVEYIELEPVFTKNLRVYEIKIHLAFIDDPTTTADDYYRQYANDIYSRDTNAPIVMVKNSSGQLINTGKAKYDAAANCLVYTCNVNYSTDYIVTATTGDYRFTGTANSKYWFSGGDDGVTQVTLSMTYQEPEPCNCICHNSIFRGIWATCLNLIYNLFGRKIVCCDDMYATLGDLLAYTAQN